MSERIGYTPTEAEIEEASTLALVAAHDALRPIMDDDLTHKEMVPIFLRAFSAARKAVQNFGNQLLTKNPEVQYAYSGLYIDTSHIVCSALYARETDAFDMIHPHSVAGSRMLALIGACRATDCLAQFESVVNDQGVCDFTSDDALDLIAKNAE